jgi:creatinine amidohydrolase
MDEVYLEQMTWEEVDAAITAGVDTVLLPIGSTEQHGPHLPLDTDCFIARALSERTARLAREQDLQVLVAPTLNITLSWYHMQFAGSMRLSTQTFMRVFGEVCESLFHHGFGHVVAVNGHGGNNAALTTGVNQYFELTGRRVFLIQWWDLAADVLARVDGPMVHAEEAETSIALALDQRVLMERATRDAWDRGAKVKASGAEWTSYGKYSLLNKGPGVVVPMDMIRDISPSGVVGDATRASRELGDEILGALIPRMVQVCAEVAGKERVDAQPRG